MFVLLSVLLFGCTDPSINCDVTDDYIRDNFSIYLGAQNSSSRAISLELRMEQSGSLMNGFFWNIWSIFIKII